MNGVRRLLGAATSSSSFQPTPQESQPTPLFSPKTTAATINSSSNPNWPPSGLTFDNSPKTTASLFLKKERPKPPLYTDDGDAAPSQAYGSPRPSQQQGSSSPHSSHNNITSPNSPSSRTSSPRRLPVHSSTMLSRTSTNASSMNWAPKRASVALNTRDELLMSLMASEAVVDSREYQVLTAEDVEELKKEYAILSARVVAMTKKVALETKIRDAAISLSRVNSSQRQVSKQSEEHLKTSERRFETAQKELWRVSESANEIQKRLLEHRAAVLAFSVRNMEKKMSPSIGSEDSGYDSSNRSTLMSPATAISSVSSSSKQSKFDGAHLFAGHADTIVPKRKLGPEAAAKEISLLEEKLKAATTQLSESLKIQGEMKKELSHIQLEKNQVETMMGMEIQTAEDTIASLEAELPRLGALDEEVKMLQQDKIEWEKERQLLEEDAREARELRERVEELENMALSNSGSERILAELRESHRRELEERDNYIKELKDEWNEEREDWNNERTVMEDEKMDDLARLQDEMDRLREADEQVLQQANEELNSTLNSLRNIVERFNIPVAVRDNVTSAMQSLVSAIVTHLEETRTNLAKVDTTRQKDLEAALQQAQDKNESLLRELEDVKRDRDSARRDTMASSRSTSIASTPDNYRAFSVSASAASVTPETSEYGPEVAGAKFLEALQPLWTVLPSPEARAAKFGSNLGSRYRINSPTVSNSPLPSPGGANLSNSQNGAPPVSLSDLDVRSLKALYDPRNKAMIAPNNGTLTFEGFIARVYALIADDRALIERLVRFAQAHDLLKKNAERAQKLALDGNIALETYQKQVKQLEARNSHLLDKLSVMQSEIQFMNENMERLTAEKLQIEARAVEQAEQVVQLSEANNTLSARALTLAEEAANAPEAIRKQLDDCKRQMEEGKKQLDDAKRLFEEKSRQYEGAQDEIEAMRSAEQGQRIALLDELNSMQTENGQLRAQLRAAKAGR